MEQANAQVPGFEGERRAQLHALATLTGRPPAEIDAAASQCCVVPKVKTLIPMGDGAALLARRPDLRVAERKLAADTARIGVATASLFPSITLLGSVSLGAPRIGNVGKSSSFGCSLGPLISWTFPNFAAARARIRQAHAGSDASLAELQGAILTALRETEQALARYGAALEQNVARARAAESAQNAADQTKQRFDSGATTSSTSLSPKKTGRLHDKRWRSRTRMSPICRFPSSRRLAEAGRTPPSRWTFRRRGAQIGSMQQQSVRKHIHPEAVVLLEVRHRFGRLLEDEQRKDSDRAVSQLRNRRSDRRHHAERRSRKEPQDHHEGRAKLQIRLPEGTKNILEKGESTCGAQTGCDCDKMCEVLQASEFLCPKSTG